MPTVTHSEALYIRAPEEASAELKDGTQRKVLLRGVVVVVAQNGLGVASDGVPSGMRLEFGVAHSPVT
jgi:hypothetical protein